jgi:nifR3 family TIM-barrel protein
MNFFSGELAAHLDSPLHIGGKWIPSRMALAPMVGLGHVVLRDIIRSFNAPCLLFTGMLNARAVPTENPRTSPLFNWREEELPYLVGQIFGNEPKEMAAAARRIAAEGFFGVDINMGCAASEIVKRGAGAALLRDPDLAVDIAAAVAEAVDIPVMVKLRTGWSSDPIPAVSLAQRLEAVGVAALCFHPRVAPDRRARAVQLAHLREVVKAVTIPVLGNGNLQGPGDIVKMWETTACAGFSVGRLAVARPWIFAQWRDRDAFAIRHREEDLFRAAPYEMLEGLYSFYSPERARPLYKRYLTYYMANFNYGSRLFGRLVRGSTCAELKARLDEHLNPLPEISFRPGAVLFI